MSVRRKIAHKVQTQVNGTWGDDSPYMEKYAALTEGRRRYYTVVDAVRVMRMIDKGMWHVIWSRYEPYQATADQAVPVR